MELQAGNALKLITSYLEICMMYADDTQLKYVFIEGGRQNDASQMRQACISDIKHWSIFVGILTARKLGILCHNHGMFREAIQSNNNRYNVKIIFGAL